MEVAALDQLKNKFYLLENYLKILASLGAIVALWATFLLLHELRFSTNLSSNCRSYPRDRGDGTTSFGWNMSAES